MESKLRKLQLKCLEILDITDRICRNHHIMYSLCGGSVVGAHLYKRILPWDDDIDLMMTRENYNKFLSVAEAELPEELILMTYRNGNYPKGIYNHFSKIVNRNTTLVQPNGDILGVFIDITVYDKVPENIFKKLEITLFKISTGKLSSSLLRHRLRNIMLYTLFFNNQRAYLVFFQAVVEFLAKTSKKYTYRELFGAYYQASTIPFRPNVFENYTEIEFENRHIMIVRDYVEYLQTRYNRTDFYEPKEKQNSHHLAYVDLNTPFQDYLRKMGKTNE